MQVCVHTFAHVGTRLSGCKNTWVHMHVEIQSLCKESSSITLLPYSLRQDLSIKLSSLIMLVLLTSKESHLLLSEARIISGPRCACTHIIPRNLHEFQGSELQSTHVYSKYFNHGPIFLTLSFKLHLFIFVCMCSQEITFMSSLY